MTARSHRSKALAPSRNRWSVALRCLLLIAAWQGPIPWCHNHGVPGDAGAQTASWLGDHWRCYHASAAPQTERRLGWHVHFDFANPERGADDSQSQPQPVIASTQLSATIVAGEDVRLPGELLSAQLDAKSHARSVQDGAVAAHFFDGFAPTLSPPLRFCVARC